MNDKEIIIVGNIENKIYSFRGKNVMLDSDLADLYMVTFISGLLRYARNDGFKCACCKFLEH